MILDIERRMRVNSQAYLVATAEGYYVAKLRGNPRTLINEWIVSIILRTLGVSVPDWRLLAIGPNTPNRDLLSFNVDNHKVDVGDGYHFGSRVPCDPNRTAIWDFLPKCLLGNVSNLGDFVTTLVVDQWLCHNNHRMAIFVREDSAELNGSRRYRAYMVDHRHAFGGGRWSFTESPRNGLYLDKEIYSCLDMPAMCEQAAMRIASLDLATLNANVAISTDCVLHDREHLDRLIGQLQHRQSRVMDLMMRHLPEILSLVAPTRLSDPRAPRAKK